MLGIDAALHNGAITDATDVERFTHDGIDAPGPAHSPAHDREPRDAVIVAHVGNQLLME